MAKILSHEARGPFCCILFGGPGLAFRAHTVDDRTPAWPYVLVYKNVRNYGSIVYMGSCRSFIITSRILKPKRQDPTDKNV